MNDITYFIGMNIVRRICPKMNGTEMPKPQASDAVLRHICAVTDKIYRRGGNSCCVCVLAAKDFGNTSHSDG